MWLSVKILGSTSPAALVFAIWANTYNQAASTRCATVVVAITKVDDQKHENDDEGEHSSDASKCFPIE